jgi:RHS repeat-associated protein
LVGLAALVATVSFVLSTAAQQPSLDLSGVFVGVAYAQDADGANASGRGLGNGASGLGGLSGAGEGQSVQGAKADQKPDTAVDRTRLGKEASDGTAEAGTAKESDAAVDPAGEGKNAGETGAEEAEPRVKRSAAAAATASTTPEPAVNAIAKASVPEITSNGSLTQSIPIDVPAFRGLEPKLALTYDSARKSRFGGQYQGFLGYAWGVDGFDVIERASPGYGVPTYEASDVYLLNGSELVACAAGMVSASCSAGGTHANENEDYRRIRFDSGSNTWTVTDRDGTVSLFRSVAAMVNFNPAAGTPEYDMNQKGRYVLASVTDTNGNAVNYAYTCPDLPMCLPQRVSYPGYAIDFHYDTRPDFQMAANGYFLTWIKHRLKSIVLYAPGLHYRVYSLTYDQAPLSNTSRLTKVERWGRDVGFDSNANPISGSRKTIRQMSYDNFAINFTPRNLAFPHGELDLRKSLAAQQVGDLNFDGRDEFYGVVAKVARPKPGERAGDAFDVQLTSFDMDGQSIKTTTQPMPNSTSTGVNTAVAGRFLAGKSVKDIFLTYTTEKAGRDQWGDPTTIRAQEHKILSVDGALGFGSTGCTGAYATVCTNISRTEATVAVGDTDGDGVDTLYGNKGTAIEQFADGRQGVVWGNTGYRLKDGAWVAYGLPADCNETRYACAFGDVNGDGVTDVVRRVRDNLQVDVWFGTGRTYVYMGGGTPLSGPPILRDMDNDGRMEILGAHKSYWSSPYFEIRAFSLWYSASGTSFQAHAQTFDASWLSGDFNGDGLPDFLNNNTMWTSNAGTGNPNLLRTVTLETGGTISVDYTPSTRFANTFLPQVLHPVTKLVVNDGRGVVSQTNYAYAGGLYDVKARKFLGFRTITMDKQQASGEAQRPVIQMTYRQDLASYGLLERTVLRNGENTASKEIAEGYEVNATSKPYWAKNVSTETTLNEGAAIRLRQERTFDSFGNVANLRDYGRTDVNGDESMTETYWENVNVSAYIVDKPRAEIKRSGLIGSSPAIRYRHFFYDNAHADNLKPPVKGNLTWENEFSALAPAYPAVNRFHSYDSYGNLIATVDRAGNRTEWDYDTSLHLFPVTERSPRYFASGGNAADTRFVTTTSYDLTCGLPSSKRDPNGIVESYTYDPHCRPFGYTNSGSGHYVNTRYENEGNPAQQRIVTYQPLSNGGGELIKSNYYDGLGRLWLAESPGEPGTGRGRITETAYDARGNAAHTALPRFYGEAPQWTVNSYDWQDRVVRTVNPDGSARTTGYQVYWGNEAAILYHQHDIDEVGRQTVTYTSTFGDVVGQWAYNGTSWVLEQARSYDPLGRLLNVTDAGGARVTYTYDLLGNRVTANDPNLGNWSYAYDGEGRLIRQTDARGAATTLAYDQMGRLTLQQVQKPGEATPTLVARNTYDEAVATPSHNIGLLTKSENGAATSVFSRNYTGGGSVLRTTSTIDGLTHTTVETRGRQDKTASIAYSPATLQLGEAAQPYIYNDADLLMSIPGYITATSYEADGQTKSITYANGVTTTFNYSPARRWLDRVTTAKGATVLMDNQYGRDLTGKIKTITGLTANDNWVYTYDLRGRLVSADNAGNNAWDETYAYADNNNLTFRTRTGTYVYPAGNAIRPHAATAIGNRSIAYDANGNMVSDGARTLAWDGANRLSTVSQNNTTVTMAYGPSGSRVKKSYAFGTTLYPDANVEIDRSIPGTDIYTRYPHPDLKIAANAQTGAVTKTFLHRDHLASVRLVTDANGNLVEQTGYAAFGERTNTAMQTQKGYIGERFDPETGLQYLNARYYDPTFGRYMPRDQSRHAR